MASTYSTNLALELMATGEKANTWGDITNTNLGTLLEQSISGYVTQAITDGSGATTTITIPNGASGVARNMFIEMTGALTFGTTSLIVPANKKLYFIYNNTSGGFAVTVKVSGLTGVSVPNGQKMVLVSNGTDVVVATNYMATLAIGALTSGRVPYATTAGLLTDSANLTFNGTTLTAGGLSSPTLTNAGTLALSATSTNIITASTNGSERMRIDSSGNVGIGTSSPSANSLTIASKNVVMTSGFGMSWNSNATQLAGYDTNILQFITASAERMRIDSSGNVGIGTSSPTTFGGSLVVYAASNPISVIASGSANAYLRLYSTSDNNMYLANIGGSMAMLTANTERMRIDSAGNTFINSSSAVWDEKLGIRTATGAGTVGIGIYSASSTYASSMVRVQAETSGTGWKMFDGRATGGTQLFYVDGTGGGYFAGNVGIGTTSPSGPLNVVSASSSLAIAINGRSSDSLGAMYFYANNGSTQYATITTSATEFRLSSVPAAAVQTFYTNGSERMRIDSSGNVLIGTNTINTISPRLTILGQTAGKQWSCGPTSGNDNFFVYNQASAGVYISYGGTSWTASSDERIKDIIEPITDAANKVSKLRAVIGKFKADEEGTRRSFLIAQDVQAVLPEAVNVQNDEIGTLGVAYTDVIPLLVAAIQELNAEIAALKAKLN